MEYHIINLLYNEAHAPDIEAVAPVLPRWCLTGATG